MSRSDKKLPHLQPLPGGDRALAVEDAATAAERETLALGDVGLGSLKIGKRLVDVGLGGFVNAKDPREVGLYGYVGVAGVVAGGGLTLHFKDDAVTEARTVLNKMGADLVQVPAEQYNEQQFWRDWVRLPDFLKRWIVNDARTVTRTLEQRGVEVHFQHGESLVK